MTCKVSVLDDPLVKREHRMVLVTCDGRSVERVTLELLGVVAAAECSETVHAMGGVTEHAAAVLNGRSLRPGSPEWKRPLLPSDVLAIARAGPGDPATIIISLLITLAAAVVSSILAPRVASAPEQPTDTRRFAFAQSSRAAVKGEPMPTVFGEHARYGPVKCVAVAGDGDNGDSILKLAYCIAGHQVERIGTRAFGSGAADNLAPGTGTGKISGIFLNDQPIENFPSARISMRFGAAGQTAMPGFVDSEVPREVAAGSGGALLANTSGMPYTGGTATEAVTYTSVDAVDALILRVTFPRGLFGIDSGSSQTVPRSVTFRYRSRAYPAGSFGAWTSKTVERRDQSILTVAPRLDNLPGGGSPARFEVQVQRVDPDSTDPAVADEMRLLEVIEVRYDHNLYVGCAMIGIILTASEQLSSEPRVSIAVRGYNKLRIWDGISDPETPTYATGYSNDPADIALALCTDPEVGLVQLSDGVDPDSGVDVPALLECRPYNRELVPAPSRGASATRPRFACNLVLIDQRPALEILGIVCGTMRARAIVADKVRVIQARPRAANAEVFTDGSIVRGTPEISASIAYTHTRDGLQVANQLTAQFANELIDGHPDVVVYPEAGDLWLGGMDAEQLVSESVKLDGITDPDQAMAEIVYQMTRRRAISKAMTFRTTSPFLQCQPLDRIGVACSLAGWGVISGRLLAGSTTATLLLDRTLTIGESGAYSVLVKQLDGSVEISTLSIAPGVYPPGAAIVLDSELAGDPMGSLGDAGQGAEYSIGLAGAGSELVPMVAAKMTPIPGPGGTAAGGGWEITAVPYDERIFDAAPGDVVLRNYSTLGAERTAPGPVVGLVLRERAIGGATGIELSWTQTPADRQHTASFRVYRRFVGSGYWQLVPGVHAGLTGVDLGTFPSDAGFDFTVVAVSPLGQSLSPYDPRVPIVSLRLGLSLDPPAPPTGLAITHVEGNSYLLTWDEMVGPPAAASYQVIAGGDTGTGKPNDGCEDGYTLARVIGTSLAVELPAGVACRFYVRSVSTSGRLSWTAATVAEASPAAPAGETIKNAYTADLSSEGTLTGATWDGGDARLEIDAPDAAPGVWESDPIDTGSVTNTTLALRLATANNAEDPLISGVTFGVPSIEADQWSGFTYGMLMPPYPDARIGVVAEVRTSTDGVTYTDYEPLPHGAEVQRMLRYYQVRVTLSRGTVGTPYSPALRGVSVVATH